MHVCAETHFPTTVVAQRPAAAVASTVQYLPDGRQVLSDGSIRNTDGSFDTTSIPQTPIPHEQIPLPRPHLVDLKAKLLKRAKELVLPVRLWSHLRDIVAQLLGDQIVSLNLIRQNATPAAACL
jgi:hypothetical protein